MFFVILNNRCKIKCIFIFIFIFIFSFAQKPMHNLNNGAMINWPGKVYSPLITWHNFLNTKSMHAVHMSSARVIATLWLINDQYIFIAIQYTQPQAFSYGQLVLFLDNCHFGQIRENYWIHKYTAAGFITLGEDSNTWVSYVRIPWVSPSSPHTLGHHGTPFVVVMASGSGSLNIFLW